MPRASLKGDPELEEIAKQRRLSQQGGLMSDIEAMKNEAMEELHVKPYDVMDFYYTTGIIQKIARSGPFTNVTLGVISINAVWMGYDTDKNDAESLAEAEIQFQAGEHFFAVFFSLELLIRFLAFERKCNTMKDGWFKFDSILCTLMVLETWILPALSGPGGGLPIDTSMLRLLRLLRLSRMMRLLRKFPELITLLKGMVAAVRSVFSTLVLLVVFMYVFAIIFRQQCKGNEAMDPYFGSMGLCFWTLLLQGTLLDNITDVLTEIKDDSWPLAALFLFFVLIGNFTVLNMLIGVLCEVVSAVSDMEKEKMTVQYAKDSFLSVLKEMDEDGSGTITQNEWQNFINDPRIENAFLELDVDREGLLSLTDVIFEGEVKHNQGDALNMEGAVVEEEGRALDFGEVLEQILMLRNSNTAVVKDVVDLRKFIKGHTGKTHLCMVQLAKMQFEVMDHLNCGMSPEGETNGNDAPEEPVKAPAAPGPAAPAAAALSSYQAASSSQGQSLNLATQLSRHQPQPSREDKGILDFLLCTDENFGMADTGGTHNGSTVIDEKTQQQIDDLRSTVAILGSKVDQIHSILMSNGK